MPEFLGAHMGAASVRGRTRSFLRHRMRRLAVPVRRRYYEGHGEKVVRFLPRVARFELGLDDPSAVRSRKVEIGPGEHPRPGYIHVDLAPYGRHSEAVAPMWDLPFPTAWAEEIVAIHSLEHAPPSKLLPTLTEWRRVLKPGGLVHICVPNGPAIMEAYNRATVAEKWSLMGSILGMYSWPALRDPSQLTARSDHQIIFDWALLQWALTTSGYEAVTDRTPEVDDLHTRAWSAMVENYSLAAEARAPA